MNPQITNRLEINLLNPDTTPQLISEFALKHKVPAIVTDPEYVAPLIAYRSVIRGRYKIISTLDFPKGKNYGMDKIFRSSPDFVAADGFEILLSSGKTEIQSRNEMKALYTYLKANRPLAEIRWVLKMHTSDLKEIEGILKNMKPFPPSFVRVDPHLITPKSSVDKLIEYAAFVNQIVPYPIKLSGNITFDELSQLKDVRGVKRFDVSMKQAELIVQSFKIAAQSDRPAPENIPGQAVKKVGNVGRINI